MLNIELFLLSTLILSTATSIFCELCIPDNTPGKLKIVETNMRIALASFLILIYGQTLNLDILFDFLKQL